LTFETFKTFLKARDLRSEIFYVAVVQGNDVIGIDLFGPVGVKGLFSLKVFWQRSSHFLRVFAMPGDA